MMRRGGAFAKPQMTRAQNGTHYIFWLTRCTDEALAKADAEAIARKYGMKIGDVTADIARQKRVRERVAL